MAARLISHIAITTEWLPRHLPWFMLGSLAACTPQRKKQELQARQGRDLEESKARPCWAGLEVCLGRGWSCFWGEGPVRLSLNVLAMPADARTHARTPVCKWTPSWVDLCQRGPFVERFFFVLFRLVLVRFRSFQQKLKGQKLSDRKQEFPEKASSLPGKF